MRFRSSRPPALVPGHPISALVALWLTSGMVPVAGHAQTVEPRHETLPAGAVTTIYPDAAALGARTVVDMLQWYVPGLFVAYCPNGLVFQVVIRGGQTSLLGGRPCETCPPRCPANPLLIIDGVQVSNDYFSAQLRSLNPFQVERIEVLRDIASTSVYGMKAAGGVILVFTRRR